MDPGQIRQVAQEIAPPYFSAHTKLLLQQPQNLSAAASFLLPVSDARKKA
jgi:hypothetical protein